MVNVQELDRANQRLVIVSIFSSDSKSVFPIKYVSMLSMIISILVGRINFCIYSILRGLTVYFKRGILSYA